MWVECEKGKMPEDVLPIHKIETNGHQFIDAVTDSVFVTDRFKQEVRECIRKHVTHPAFGSDWYWEEVNGNKFDGFQARFWSENENKEYAYKKYMIAGGSVGPYSMWWITDKDGKRKNLVDEGVAVECYFDSETHTYQQLLK